MRRLNARIRIDSKSTSDMDPIKLPIRPANRFSRSPKNGNKSNFLIYASISIALVLLLCFIFVFGRKNSSNFGNKRYGIVIDGGSTGTRIHVFGYVVQDRKPVFDFGKDGLASMRVNPGLSSYAADPEAAGGSLAELLEFGKGRVPKEFWKDTEIRLMATAGLRLLEPGVQDRILDSCRLVLHASGFKFRNEWASVITEGNRRRLVNTGIRGRTIAHILAHFFSIFETLQYRYRESFFMFSVIILEHLWWIRNRVAHREETGNADFSMRLIMNRFNEIKNSRAHDFVGRTM